MFQLQGLDHVALQVRDVERSTRWYREVLGLERLFEEVWGSHPAVVGRGRTSLALFPAADADPSAPRPPQMRHLAFRAGFADFHAAREALAARGIPVELEDHGVSHSIYFRDPDGYQLEITTYDLPTDPPTADPHPGERLRSSWEANAEGWTTAVRTGAIASRRLATDEAVVDAVLARAPRRVLDVGCGEGWLARALAAHGIEVVGVDGSAGLVERARESGGATFHLCSYAELVADPGRVGEGYDVAVCNFSLLDRDLAPLLEALRSRLRGGGALVVQTVHPWSGRGESAYRDGWQTETFAGLGTAAMQPMPWHYRTLASWVELLRQCGYRIEEAREPTHPETGEPLSLILACLAAAAEPEPSRPGAVVDPEIELP